MFKKCGHFSHFDVYPEVIRAWMPSMMRNMPILWVSWGNARVAPLKIRKKLIVWGVGRQSERCSVEIRNMPIVWGVHRQSERCSVEIKNMPIVWGVHRQSERCTVEIRNKPIVWGVHRQFELKRARKPLTFPFWRCIGVKLRENGLKILVHSHSDGVSLVKTRIPFENRMMESFR